MKALGLAITLVALLAAPAAAQWVEDGDAGELPNTAQVPVGAGPLTTIRGFCDIGDVDMYCIHIDDIVGTFDAKTCDGTTWDSQLFLFTEVGVGVITDDEGCPVFGQADLPPMADYGCAHTGPGSYLIAISRFNGDPLDAGGGSIFIVGSGCAADADPVTGWVETFAKAGAYTIYLEGTSYCGGATAVEAGTWGSIKTLYR